MPDQYGGTVLPTPALRNETQAAFEVGAEFELPSGDILLGYLGNFVATIMTAYCLDIWHAVQPNKPLVRRVFINEPEEDFVESNLPALYVYRPGRETRELIESFNQIADDYRIQKGRIVVMWVTDPLPVEGRRNRGQLCDTLRKAIDRALYVGRDPKWKVFGDPDPKAATWGSGLLPLSGAAVIELMNAAPGIFTRKMKIPAPDRHYEMMKMSFDCEEQYVPDLTLVGDPQTSVEATYVSPDQGTGLGPFELGHEIDT